MSPEVIAALLIQLAATAPQVIALLQRGDLTPAELEAALVAEIAALRALDPRALIFGEETQ